MEEVSIIRISAQNSLVALGGFSSQKMVMFGSGGAEVTQGLQETTVLVTKVRRLRRSQHPTKVCPVGSPEDHDRNLIVRRKRRTA